MKISDRTLVEVSPNNITYRTPIAFSAVVVKVWLMGNDVRIMFYTEDYKGTKPISMFQSEIETYIKDAKSRLGK